MLSASCVSFLKSQVHYEDLDPYYTSQLFLHQLHRLVIDSVHFTFNVVHIRGVAWLIITHWLLASVDRTNYTYNPASGPP